MSIWGHLGSWSDNVIFTKKAITYPCNTAWPCNSYMVISLIPSIYVMGSNVNIGSFGVTEIKRSFSLKCCNPSMLHSMTIKMRLIYVHQLETFIFYGFECQSGVIWVTGQGSKGCSNLKHFQTLRNMHVGQLETFYLCWGQMSIWGHFGVTGVKRSFSQKCYNPSM